MKRKLIIATTATMLMLSGCKNAAVSAEASSIDSSTRLPNFSDISEQWAKTSIEKATVKGYVDGYDDSTFRPEQKVSRAEFIKMIVTATKLTVSGEASGSEWFKPYISAAINANILREKDFEDNNMNKAISRLEMSRIALRASNKTLQNKAMQMDDRSIMFNTTKNGLIQGLAGGELGLDKSTTRAQSVTIIERVLTVQGGGKLEVDKAAQSFAEIELRGNNFETMWGVRVKEFPYTHHLGDGLDLVINKAVVIDHTDSNSAYYELFKSGKLGLGQNTYSIAYQMTINNSTKKDHYAIYPVQFISTLGYSRSYTLTNDLKVAWMDQIGETTGWISFNKSKDEVDKLLASGNIPRIELDIQSQLIDFLKKE
ncbi:S-layer homology domain-containing protein [Bacillus sp. 3255]|uniref:S-layer homology domain-containing protein n=1 Tax=Bacillus sp. 3255 TaxID=2817904 RepID=UPI002858DAB2|nr:S-layer homology domain-containing protein [Bacillus sp. 3255]MDR6884859.1 hypothetical protein [Bacillus sp. 3255]